MVKSAVKHEDNGEPDPDRTLLDRVTALEQDLMAAKLLVTENKRMVNIFRQREVKRVVNSFGQREVPLRQLFKSESFRQHRQETDDILKNNDALLDQLNSSLKKTVETKAFVTDLQFSVKEETAWLLRRNENDKKRKSATL